MLVAVKTKLKEVLCSKCHYAGFPIGIEGWHVWLSEEVFARYGQKIKNEIKKF